MWSGFTQQNISSRSNGKCTAELTWARPQNQEQISAEEVVCGSVLYSGSPMTPPIFPLVTRLTNSCCLTYAALPPWLQSLSNCHSSQIYSTPNSWKDSCSGHLFMKALLQKTPSRDNCCRMLRVLICNLSPGCLHAEQFNLQLHWVTGGCFTLQKWEHLFLNIQPF